MKISFYDSPYPSVLKYIESEKGSGINNDLSRNDPSCNELMASILGVPDKNKNQFRRIEITARLISDDIVAYEPSKYEKTGNEAVDTVIWNIAYKWSELVTALTVIERMDLYVSRSARQQLIEKSISELIHWEGYYFKEIWDHLDEGAKHAVCAHLHEVIDDYYPVQFIESSGAGSLFLSSGPHVNQFYTRSQTQPSADNILAILAMSGIDVALPKIYSEELDVIDEIKETFESERQDYIVFLRQYVNDCYLGIKAGDYKDVWTFAEFKSNNELLQKLHAFEKAVAGSDKMLIRDSVRNISGKSVAIAQAVISGNLVAAGWRLLEALIKTMQGGTDRTNASKELPMVSYLYQIKNSANT